MFLLILAHMMRFINGTNTKHRELRNGYVDDRWATTIEDVLGYSAPRFMAERVPPA